MPLRFRLKKLYPETIQEFELAAEERYFEALELLVSGYPGGGIYLMGYVGEMLLKVAYFRYDGARPADLIEPRPGPAKRRGRSEIPSVERESYHSVLFWALLLMHARRSRNDPLPVDVEAPFRQRTRRLYQNWWVEMRYRKDRSEPLEMRSIYDDVTRLRDNHVALWS